VSGAVFTSTEYPADQVIPLHNENSYTNVWPRKLWFCSAVVAQEGGCTPLADSRRVLQRIEPAIRQVFEAKNVMYVRNYIAGIDLGWQTVFQTSSKEEVNEFCQAHGIEVEWQGEQLRTWQVCQAVATHAETGESVWFNQAHLFHVSSLSAAISDALLTQFGERGLPRHAYFGDGSPIPAEALDHIRAAYAAEEVRFHWRKGDVLILDNKLVAHGRDRFSGPRKVLVAMTEAQHAT
jgi:alpha-ketoglutarate-dependent taurine dioxygenase